MKKFILFLIVLFCIASVVYAEDEGDIIEEYIDIYSGDLSRAADEGKVYEALPEFDAEELLMGSARGGRLFETENLLNRLGDILFKEIKSVLKIMLYIMAISILSSYLSALPQGKSQEVSEVAYYACYIVTAGIAAATFLEIVGCFKTAVDSILIVARIVVPLVITSLYASGAVISASVFHPVLLGIIEISFTLIDKIFIPVLMLKTALGIASGVSDKVNANKMIEFLEKTVKWGLSVLLTVFVGVVGLQSIASSGADGLSVRITKYAASNLIPVVGGILSETVETVMSCSVVIKNAVGITGIVILVGTALLPLIKISACLIVLRITSAIIQPVSDGKTVKCISGIADSVGLLFAILASVTVMFVIILTIMLKAGMAGR